MADYGPRTQPSQARHSPLLGNAEALKNSAQDALAGRLPDCVVWYVHPTRPARFPRVRLAIYRAGRADEYAYEYAAHRGQEKWAGLVTPPYAVVQDGWLEE